MLLPIVPDRATAQPAEPLQVVATFSILGDIVANVGGDAIQLESIVPAGGDAHTFDPTPDQVAGVSDADLIFEIGIGFEPWLADMVEASGTSAQEIVVTDGLDLIEGDDEHADEAEHAEEASPEADDHEAEEHEDEAEEEGHEHEDGAVDPHVWGDVANVIAITATVKDALVAADPANAATYEANAAAYTTQLQELDQWIRTEVARLPDDRHKRVRGGWHGDRIGVHGIGRSLGAGHRRAGGADRGDRGSGDLHRERLESRPDRCDRQ
jgi:ABC-type Zn uptake system ZnuABC Zn-binding protein ZnuA